MLADDHHSVRQAYSGLLGMKKKFEVIGQAENGQALLDLVAIREPDIVILDLEMPVMDGKMTLIHLQKNHPSVKVIILSFYKDDLMIFDALINGASSYLSKCCSIENIFETIEKVHANGFYFDGIISKQVVLQLFSVDKTLVTNILSEREIEILKLFCNGAVLKQIADKLYISVNTVKYHMKSIHRKTEIHSTQQLVKFAIKNALTNLD